ncbi:MAG: class I tRNA ligase family protein, partial [Acidimicrobiales bacterium]
GSGGEHIAASAAQLRRDTHHAIAKVSADIERYGFNTAVAALMELTNSIYRHLRAGTDQAVVDEATDTLLELLAPFAPHLAAEAYERRRGLHVHVQPWPVADPALLKASSVSMPVQVDGKVREVLEVDPDITEEEAVKSALGSDKVVAALGGREPRRIIARPPKIVNIVA